MTIDAMPDLAFLGSPAFWIACGGVALFVTSNIYVRPQFDLHWVHNYNQLFNSNWVPQYGVQVGYRFGD